jgi:hypothetical protein
MVLCVTWVWWQTEESGFPHPPFFSLERLMKIDMASNRRCNHPHTVPRYAVRVGYPSVQFDIRQENNNRPPAARSSPQRDDVLQNFVPQEYSIISISSIFDTSRITRRFSKKLILDLLKQYDIQLCGCNEEKAAAGSRKTTDFCWCGLS